MPSAAEGEARALPVHVGIIMDGNGRWARRRNLPRTQGHLEGLQAAKRVVQAAADLGIPYVTLYAFSTENWKRAAEEVGFIMNLVQKYLFAELDFYRRNRIRIRHAGDLSGLAPEIRREIERVRDQTATFDGLTLTLALNYGGRDEIVRAVRSLIAEGTAPEALTEDAVRRHLDNPDIPDPDLVIRSAGEYRSSNFLLWEAAYAEFYVSDVYWPDWTANDLADAIQDYQRRERRFGGIKE
jgi:undecaprenyl diphosphate synthase